MDKFGICINEILHKAGKLTPTEKYCHDAFYDIMKKYIHNFNHSIYMHDILTTLYNKLLNDNIQIISLKFSDGNSIYIDKKILSNITFFNNYFTDNYCNDFLIELPLIGPIDNYELIGYVIEFVCNKGKILHDFSYETIYKLLIISDYLIDVNGGPYDDSDYWIEGNTILKTLKEYLHNNFLKIAYIIRDEPITDKFNEESFYILYELLKAFSIKKIKIRSPFSILYKYRNMISKTPLNEYIIYDVD